MEAARLDQKKNGLPPLTLEEIDEKREEYLNSLDFRTLDMKEFALMNPAERMAAEDARSF
jgi:hypothetical protein